MQLRTVRATKTNIKNINMSGIIENKKNARIAGLWYLILAIGSGYSWMYISKTFIIENATLTAENILRTESQFITSIIFSIVGQIAFILFALTLYRLFKTVNQIQARLMLTLVLISVSIMFVNIIFQTSSLVLLNRSDYFRGFTDAQISDLATMFLHLNIIGVYIVDIFWGLWLFPLAFLTFKSGFFPKIIAIVLVISGIGYIVDSLSFIINQDIHTILRNYLSMPEAFGEVVLLLWLLIKGVSTPKN